jgi:biopolymer transport protein ExbB/TolQ
MARANNRNVLIKTLLTIVSVIVAYFSVVSTMTISRVGSLEEKVNEGEKEISRNEKNTAVLLEKVTTIEQLVREMRQEMTKIALSRADSQHGSP